MSLEAILAARREKSVGRLKPEHREKQERHITELRATGMSRALGVGAAAPAFALPTGSGKLVDSRALLAQGPLVVSFFRGKWCPYCVSELQALEEIVPELRALGATLVAISPERAERNRELIEAQNFSFDILVDRGNAVAAAYGVDYVFPAYLQELYGEILKHDIASFNDDTAWKLPIPARFVIDTSGIIREAKVDPDYRHRPEPVDSLAVVRSLVAAAV